MINPGELGNCAVRGREEILDVQDAFNCLEPRIKISLNGIGKRESNGVTGDVGEWLVQRVKPPGDHLPSSLCPKKRLRVRIGKDISESPQSCRIHFSVVVVMRLGSDDARNGVVVTSLAAKTPKNSTLYLPSILQNYMYPSTHSTGK